MLELAINLLASVITGAAVWLAGWVRRRRRAERMRAFFGVRPGDRARVIVARHHASPEDLSVHREDAAAAVELAATVMACGGRADLVGFDRAPAELGGTAELCVGGPSANRRTDAHLRLLAPGVRYEHRSDAHRVLLVGDRSYEWTSGALDADLYAAVIKTYGSPGTAPVFIICGMTALSNRAAAHHLVTNHRQLAQRYGTDGRFALLLTLRGLHSYGPDAIVDVDDVSEAAFTTP